MWMAVSTCESQFSFHWIPICITNRVSRITSRCINCEVDASKTGRVFVFFCGRPDVFKAFALGGILDLQMFVGLQDPYLDRSLTY